MGYYIKHFFSALYACTYVCIPLLFQNLQDQICPLVTTLTFTLIPHGRLIELFLISTNVP